MITENIPEKTVFGLDIGTRSVVGTVGYRKPSGEFVILAQKIACHETRAMLDGQIHDIGKVAETVCSVKSELERELGIKLSEVCIAAAGRVLKTVNVHVDHDLHEDTTITDDMVLELELKGMEQAGINLKSQETDGVQYYCVGYTVVKYYLGNISMLNLEGHKGKSISADVIATFLPRDVIDGLNAVCDRARLKVVNLTLEPIAAINIAIPDKFRLLNLALVDVGAGTADICITKGGSIIGYGMLPCAGDFLTESLMFAFLTDFATAEEIKFDYSAKKEKITFRDVMGITQTVDYNDVDAVLKQPIDNLTSQIAEKIIELNGGSSTSAIFIVGGGGKICDFSDILAGKCGLATQRVALRGEEVFENIISNDGNIVKDPMLVTPIGICMNYYEKNNNFIMVRLNDLDIKLYDNGQLNVMDATVGAGIPNDMIFPRRGRNLEFTLNGDPVIVRGKTGDSSTIILNGKPASVSTPLAANDEILFTESTEGDKGALKIKDTDEFKKGIRFVINGKQLECPCMCLANGFKVEPDYDIQNGDIIEVADYYYLSDILQMLSVGSQHSLVINNNELNIENCNLREKIFENYIIDVREKAGSIHNAITAPAHTDKAPRVIDTGDDSAPESKAVNSVATNSANTSGANENAGSKAETGNVANAVEIRENGSKSADAGAVNVANASGANENAGSKTETGNVANAVEIKDNGSKSADAGAVNVANASEANENTGSKAETGNGIGGSISADASTQNTQKFQEDTAKSFSISSLIKEIPRINKITDNANTSIIDNINAINSISKVNEIDSYTENGAYISEKTDDSVSENSEITGRAENEADASDENTAGCSKEEDVFSDVFAVTVNGEMVELTGKKNYIFVDILDKYNFDTSKALGSRVVLKRNGEPSDFVMPIENGDELELYWE